MHAESALRTAKIEGAQHLAELKKQDVLNIERAVKVHAKAWNSKEEIPAGCKVVHLVRHGQGFHNLLGDLYRDFGVEVDSTGKGDSGPYTRPEILDPPLTAIGRDQAKRLQPLTSTLGIELVVVSPLCRAVQTANLAMPHLRGRDTTGTTDKTVPWIALEAVAEASGKNSCDKRRDKTDIEDDFPHLDLSDLVTESDNRWTSERETARSVSDRAHSFLLWLRARPESQVAVVTHSAWLFTLLQTAILCETPDLANWFLTGELRTLLLSYEDSDS